MQWNFSFRLASRVARLGAFLRTGIVNDQFQLDPSYRFWTQSTKIKSHGNNEVIYCLAVEWKFQAHPSANGLPWSARLGNGMASLKGGLSINLWVDAWKNLQHCIHVQMSASIKDFSHPQCFVHSRMEVFHADRIQMTKLFAQVAFSSIHTLKPFQFLLRYFDPFVAIGTWNLGSTLIGIQTFAHSRQTRDLHSGFTDRGMEKKFLHEKYLKVKSRLLLECLHASAGYNNKYEPLDSLAPQYFAYHMSQKQRNPIVKSELDVSQRPSTRC